MIMNAAGKIIDEAWRELPDHYANLKLDQFIVMPNHFHAIAILDGESYVLSEIVRGFKTWSSRRINKLERAVGKPVWQRSFYDHVIRDDKDLEGIREYIVNNPLKWDLDHDNPSYFQITGNVH